MIKKFWIIQICELCERNVNIIPTYQKLRPKFFAISLDKDFNLVFFFVVLRGVIMYGIVVGRLPFR